MTASPNARRTHEQSSRCRNAFEDRRRCFIALTPALKQSCLVDLQGSGSDARKSGDSFAECSLVKQLSQT